jgi:hypothetical protein
VTAVFSGMSLGAIDTFTGDGCSWVEMGADQDACIVSGLEVTSGRSAEDRQRGVFPGVQGATVLHCLARLYEMAIQGATQGATKCYTGCYIFPSLEESGLEPSVDYSTGNSEEPI